MPCFLLHFLSWLARGDTGGDATSELGNAPHGARTGHGSWDGHTHTRHSSPTRKSVDMQGSDRDRSALSSHTAPQTSDSATARARPVLASSLVLNRALSACGIRLCPHSASENPHTSQYAQPAARTRDGSLPIGHNSSKSCVVRAALAPGSQDRREARFRGTTWLSATGVCVRLPSWP